MRRVARTNGMSVSRVLKESMCRTAEGSECQSVGVVIERIVGRDGVPGRSESA